MTQKATLLGLTGTNGSGKGEAAAFFKKNGFEYHSLSDVIREELRKGKQEITRDSLIKMGNALREQFGPEILARRVMDKVQGRAVIDSIRNPKEVDFLRKQDQFLLLAVDAPIEIRYKRTEKRGRDESAHTLAEFTAKEQEEMTSAERGQQLQTCINMADHVIINDHTLETLYKKLERFL
jgi:dephospho-CoA kinase